jgi:hypothetical protein
MKNVFILTLLSFLVSACSSIKTLSSGKKYEVDCHRLTSSDQSCAEKIADECSNGFVIEKSVSKYKLLKGPYRSVTVACK